MRNHYLKGMSYELNQKLRGELEYQNLTVKEVFGTPVFRSLHSTITSVGVPL